MLTFREFLAATTVHGLPELIRSKTKKGRFLYATIFIVCNTFAVVGMFNIVSQYIDRPVATSYVVQQAKYLDVPDVTMCPFNRLHKGKLQQLGISGDLAKYMEWAFLITNPPYRFRPSSETLISDYAKVTRLGLELEEKLHELNMTFGELVVNVSMTCEDFVMKCEQQYRPYDCCQASQRFMTSMGVCFKVGE